MKNSNHLRCENNGVVTVFLCLIVTTMILLGSAVIKITAIYNAKCRVNVATKTAMSCVRADYNSYIFKHYHILLFDKTYYGLGEGETENIVENNLSDNLGNDFDVENVMATSFDMLCDDEYAEFKEQISDYMLYGIAEYSIDKISEKTGGEDATLDSETEQKIENAEDGIGSVAVDNNISDSDAKNSGEISKKISSDEDKTTSTSEEYDSSENRKTSSSEEYDSSENGKTSSSEEYDSSDVEDPRDFTEDCGKDGLLLSLLLPIEKNPSHANADFTDTPSLEDGLDFTSFSNNTKFDDYDDFKDDLKSQSSWTQNLSDDAQAIPYAMTVFNNFISQDKNDTSVMTCEVEYLISGKFNDYDNLEDVCRKIIAIRLPMNMSYIITDTAKMNLIKTISVPLATATVIVPESVYRYLIAGAWSYIESMAEVRNLLAGNKIDFVKTKENWMTDINDIEGTLESEQNSEKGLSYEDYLMILLMIKNDKLHSRMLDLMDINARTENEKFRIKNAAVGFETDVKVNYSGYEIFTHEYVGY